MDSKYQETSAPQARNNSLFLQYIYRKVYVAVVRLRREEKRRGETTRNCFYKSGFILSFFLFSSQSKMS